MLSVAGVRASRRRCAQLVESFLQTHIAARRAIVGHCAQLSATGDDDVEAAHVVVDRHGALCAVGRCGHLPAAQNRLIGDLGCAAFFGDRRISL